jgi:thiamine-monophosphate kinase
MGAVPKGKALLRSNAKVGDFIYVTGQLGDAGLGLKIKQGYICDNPAPALARFNQPQPRVAQGLALRDVAHACIDISDGLAADLGHILEKSAVGASLDWDKLPLSAEVQRYIQQSGDWQLPLVAGDDYELCFTAPPAQSQLPDGCYCVGVIEAKAGLRILRDGQPQTLEVTGFEHFS